MKHKQIIALLLTGGLFFSSSFSCLAGDDITVRLAETVTFEDTQDVIYDTVSESDIETMYEEAKEQAINEVSRSNSTVQSGVISGGSSGGGSGSSAKSVLDEILQKTVDQGLSIDDYDSLNEYLPTTEGSYVKSGTMTQEEFENLIGQLNQEIQDKYNQAKNNAEESAQAGTQQAAQDIIDRASQILNGYDPDTGQLYDDYIPDTMSNYDTDQALKDLIPWLYSALDTAKDLAGTPENDDSAYNDMIGDYNENYGDTVESENEIKKNSGDTSAYTNEELLENMMYDALDKRNAEEEEYEDDEFFYELYSSAFYTMYDPESGETVRVNPSDPDYDSYADDTPYESDNSAYGTMFTCATCGMMYGFFMHTDLFDNDINRSNVTYYQCDCGKCYEIYSDEWMNNRLFGHIEKDNYAYTDIYGVCAKCHQKYSFTYSCNCGKFLDGTMLQNSSNIFKKINEDGTTSSKCKSCGAVMTTSNFDDFTITSEDNLYCNSCWEQKLQADPDRYKTADTSSSDSNNQDEWGQYVDGEFVSEKVSELLSADEKEQFIESFDNWINGDGDFFDDLYNMLGDERYDEVVSKLTFDDDMPDFTKYLAKYVRDSIKPEYGSPVVSVSVLNDSDDDDETSKKINEILDDLLNGADIREELDGLEATTPTYPEVDTSQEDLNDLQQQYDDIFGSDLAAAATEVAPYENPDMWSADDLAAMQEALNIFSETGTLPDSWLERMAGLFGINLDDYKTEEKAKANSDQVKSDFEAIKDTDEYNEAAKKVFGDWPSDRSMWSPEMTDLYNSWMNAYNSSDSGSGGSGENDFKATLDGMTDAGVFGKDYSRDEILDNMNKYMNNFSNRSSSLTDLVTLNTIINVDEASISNQSDSYYVEGLETVVIKDQKGNSVATLNNRYSNRMTWVANMLGDFTATMDKIIYEMVWKVYTYDTHISCSAVIPDGSLDGYTLQLIDDKVVTRVKEDISGVSEVEGTDQYHDIVRDTWNIKVIENDLDVNQLDFYATERIK